MRIQRVNSLRSGYQRIKLGDCATFINGRAYAQAELLDEGTPVLRIQNLNGGDRWYYSNLDLPEEKYCEAGDLLFAWSASFGPYIWEGPKAIFHYHIWKVIPGQKLDKRYAFYLLGYITNELKASARGIAMMHLTKSGMEAWQVDLPPIEDQRRIAAILDQADALRHESALACAKVMKFGQSLFRSLFGDSAEPKFSAESLEALTSEIYRYPTYYDIDYLDNGVPEVRGELIRADGTIAHNTDRLRYISSQTSQKFPKTILVAGDLVMSVRGTIGKIGIVPNALNGANITANLIRIAPDRSKVHPLYLWHAMRSPKMESALEAASSTTTIATIKAPDLRALRVPYAPMSAQLEFVRQIEMFQLVSDKVNTQRHRLCTLFASLQSQYFVCEPEPTCEASSDILSAAE